jgi:V/A-type H+-transporting ATPase subunit I
VAVEKVARVVLAVHNDCLRSVLAVLQRQGLVHIIRSEQPEAGPTETGRLRGRLVEAIEALASREKKRRGMFGSPGPAYSREEFDRAAAAYDPEPGVEQLTRLRAALAELDGREKSLRAELNRVRPWQALEAAPDALAALPSTKPLFGRVPSRDDLAQIEAALAGRPAALECVGESADGLVCVVLCPGSDVAEVSALLAAHRFEQLDLRGVSRPPAEALAEMESALAGLVGQRAELQSKLDALAAELPRLRVAADAAANVAARTDVAAALPRTESATLVHGWVKERDFGRLERLAEQAGPAAVVRTEPEPGEEPPVALTNPKPFRPFEMVLELFSLPSAGELDPTVLIAPFFAVSFGLCLTDAGYGIVSAVITYLLMRKLGAGNKLLGIILWGSLVTIPAGALVGGWFGDIPDRLGIPWLLGFKNALMWFDPVKDPMKFFVLSLVFGYVHMIYGMLIEIGDCIRVRNWGDAFLGQLPWFAALNALTALVLLGRQLPEWGRAALMAVMLVSVAAVIVFTQRTPESMPNQWLWFGLASLGLLFIGAKLRWLPAGWLQLKWGLLGWVAVMYAYTLVMLARTRKLKPFPVAFGLAGLALFGLYFVHRVPGVIALLVSCGFFFAAPPSKANLAKLAWGGYALYGATGFVGVVLSYIRLMALGMVTGGIAVTVNVIAWMVLGIPVVGIVLAVIILVGGHAYNIAVNILGAFVHSLRLNYVEFFPRFYSGGSEPFRPFREDFRYTTVRSQ